MKSILFLLIFCSIYPLFGQDLTVNWSEKFNLSRKEYGYFNRVLGSNSNLIFTLFTNGNSKVKIVAFDKQKLNLAKQVNVVGYPENSQTNSMFKGLNLEKTLIYEKKIILFFQKQSKEGGELFIQVYDENLKLITSLKKIYEIKSTSGKIRKPEFFISANNNLDQKIIIGGELSVEKGKNIQVEYKVLNSDLTLSKPYQVEIPIENTNSYYKNDFSYLFGDDGNFHIKYKNILMIINFNSGKQKVFQANLDNKSILDFNYSVSKENIKIFGFFCDLTKDSKGKSIHGVFYSLINSNSLESLSQSFTYFSKETIGNLYQDKFGVKEISNTKKNQSSENESISSDYVIEKYDIIEDDIVLFCSKMKNVETTKTTKSTQNGQTTTTTMITYYCGKENVTSFRINSKGEIIWSSNISRYKTYSGSTSDVFNTFDVNVIENKTAFYTLYGSDFINQTDEKSTPELLSKYLKSKKISRDKIEYAIIEKQSGKSVVKNLIINKPNTQKKDLIIFDISKSEVVDNKFLLDASSSTLFKTVFRFGILSAN